MATIALGALVFLSQADGSVHVLSRAGVEASSFSPPSGPAGGGAIAQAVSKEWAVFGFGGSKNDARFYDATMASLVASVTIAVGSGRSAAVGVTDNFFFNQSTPVSKYSVAGASVLDTSVATHNRDVLGVTMDGVTSYTGVSGDPTVFKVVIGGATSTFIDNSATFDQLEGGGSGNGIVVLQDGTVITAWRDGTTNDPFIMAHSSAGALLWRVDLTASTGGHTNYVDHITRDASATSFLMGFYNDNTSTVYYYEVATSNGAQTTLFTKSAGFSGYGPFVRSYGSSTTTTPVITPVPATTPLGPQTPCNPQAQVSGGGMGAAGCNVGGVGKTPIAFDDYGAVPNHPDPDPGETLTGKSSVDMWIALHHRNYPATSPETTTYRRALVELADDPDYHGGRKEAGLLTVGDIEHGLGNESGGFEAADCDLHLSDAVDRWIRTLLDGQEIEGDEIEIYLASRESRDAFDVSPHTPPRTLMRAVVQGPSTETSLQSTLQAVDLLFSIFGPFGATPNWPYWKIGDIYADAPADVKVRPVPELYGPKSDAGATDPLTGASREKGLVPWHLVGQTTIAGTDSSALLPTSEDAGVGAFDEQGVLGGSGNWVSNGVDVLADPYHAWARVVDNVMGPLNTGRASTPSPSGTVYGFRHVGNDTGPSDYYISFQIPPDLETWDPFTNPAPGRTDIRYQIVSATATDPFTDWQFIAYWQSPTDGLEWGGAVAVEEWDAYLVLLGASYQGGGVYASNLGGGDPSQTHDRVALDMASRNGSDILWPWNEDGSAADAWPFADTFIDVVGSDGNTYRLTMGFARGGISDDHKNGVVNITCNMRCGREDVGDGSGLPLVDAHDCEQHWIENELLGRYRTGLWVTNATAPTWPDGTYKVRSTRFRDRQAFTADALGGRGLTASWYVGESKPIQAHIADWNNATETALGLNGNGSISLGYIDETVDQSTWPRVRHVTDIFGRIQARYGMFRENAVTVTWDWDPEAQKFRGGPLPLTNDVAIEKFKGHQKPGQDIASPILDDETQVRWVMNRRLARLGTGLTVMDVPGTMGFLDVDVDDPGIQLTTIEGIGSDGYVDRPMQIRRRRFSIASRIATYTLWDVHDYLLATRFTDGLARQSNVIDTVDAADVVTDDEDVAPLVLL